MNAFDRAMQHLDKAFGFVSAPHSWVSRKDEADKIIVVERGEGPGLRSSSVVCLLRAFLLPARSVFAVSVPALAVLVCGGGGLDTRPTTCSGRKADRYSACTLLSFRRPRVCVQLPPHHLLHRLSRRLLQAGALQGERGWVLPGKRARDGRCPSPLLFPDLFQLRIEQPPGVALPGTQPTTRCTLVPLMSSYTHAGPLVGAAQVVLSSDEEVFGGWRNVTKDSAVDFYTQQGDHDNRPNSMLVRGWVEGEVTQRTEGKEADA